MSEEAPIFAKVEGSSSQGYPSYSTDQQLYALRLSVDNLALQTGKQNGRVTMLEQRGNQHDIQMVEVRAELRAMLEAQKVFIQNQNDWKRLIFGNMGNILATVVAAYLLIRFGLK